MNCNVMRDKSRLSCHNELSHHSTADNNTELPPQIAMTINKSFPVNSIESRSLKFSNRLNESSFQEKSNNNRFKMARSNASDAHNHHNHNVHGNSHNNHNNNQQFTRSPAINNSCNSSSYRPFNKQKRFNRRPDDPIQIDGGDLPKLNHHNHINHDKYESFPFKFFNGNDNSGHASFTKNTNFNPEKSSDINKRNKYTVEFEHSRGNFKDLHAPLSMDNQVNKSLQDESTRSLKIDKRKPNHKWVNKRHIDPRSNIKTSEKYNSTLSSISGSDKNQMKIKLNFLQESQLTSEQLVDSNENSCSSVSNNDDKSVQHLGDYNTDTNVLQKQQINGLNPSAVEFTPSIDKKSNEKSERYLMENMENNMKILSVNGDSGNNHQTITNPVVLDDGLINGNPFSYSFYDQQYPNIAAKLTPTDPTMIHHNIYQPYPSTMPLARPLSRVNYTPTQPQIVPQFQVALYGGNNQLFRYNPSSQTQVPLNYLVYSPVMINGLYNQLYPNRIFPIGAAAATDIPAGGGNHLNSQFAHHFNANPNANTNAISVTNQPSYFTDSININNTSTSNNSHIR